MDTKYTLLNRYRLAKHLSMEDFRKEIGLSYDIVYKTLKGLTVPHDYNKQVFDEYFHNREDKILSTVLNKETV